MTETTSCRSLASELDVKVSLHPAQASQRPCERPVGMKKTMLAARYETQVDALAGKVAPVEQVHRHLPHLLYRFLRDSRTETPQGSQPACASGDGATRRRSITERHSLFPTSLPALPWLRLAAYLAFT